MSTTCFKHSFTDPKFTFWTFDAEMNDPGLHKPANEAAKDVGDKVQKEEEKAEEEEEEYLDPRYVQSWKFGQAAKLIYTVGGGSHQQRAP